ncbi:ParA family protein [Sanguibacter sp. HDW7]|uniref:AAA family ATPase n=1 Tax=Sanguibacter sp. HDW7 TaxID=2714931 RepID=UPI00140B51FC|nr:ParA family protein [Sanguibacter sp. HDW7]QIK82899.1 ParA family protein [Sanguibacter sp. HDW7]
MSSAVRPRDVLCAVGADHEDVVATVLAGTRAPVRLVRRCAHLVEMLGLLESGTGEVVLVSVERSAGDRLDRDTVARAQACGAVVVALVESVDDDGAAEAARAWALGVDLVLPTTLLDDALGERLGAAARRTATPAPMAEPATTADDPSGALGADPRRAPGHLVVVWGPPGSPGRTTTAVNLAAELAAHRPRQIGHETPRVLLVDADSHAPSVAQHLALLDESSGLALAVRAAGQGRLDVGVLSGLAPPVGLLHVLTGIARAARWPELSGAALEAVWLSARELADIVVVDVAAPLEHDEALSYDTRAPQRNAATLSALAAADTIVIVGGADPVAVQRLVHGLGDLGEIPALTRDRLLVLTRARASVTGGRPASVLGDALARYAGVRPDHVVPDDVAAHDTALLEGGTLAEHAPGSPVRRVYVALAEEVLARRRAGLERHAAAAGARSGG